MENPFPYSDTNKRYHTYSYFLKHKFGGKVARLSLNAGFGCPNLDGTRGRGGCTYCSSQGSGDFAGDPRQNLLRQMAQQKALMSKKWPCDRFIAYFQARTNTYAPLEKLKTAYETALTEPGVVGISIATRPDCIWEELCDYLQELSRLTFVEVELGLQSVFDCTGSRINRCHTFEEFLAGYEMLQSRNIPVCVHLINGLPGENHDMMVESARQVGLLRPHGVKLHLLHIIEGTRMAEEWRQGLVPLMEKDEYINTLCDQLEVLPPETVIERVTGDGDAATLLGPLWSRDKKSVMNGIDKELARRGSVQGLHFEEKPLIIS